MRCRSQWPRSQGMNCLRSLEHWDRGFEFYSRHECLCVRLFCVYVVLCIGIGLAMGWSLVQEVLPSVKKRLRNWRRSQGPTEGCRAIDEWVSVPRGTVKRRVRLYCLTLAFNNSYSYFAHTWASNCYFFFHCQAVRFPESNFSTFGYKAARSSDVMSFLVLRDLRFSKQCACFPCHAGLLCFLPASFVVYSSILSVPPKRRLTYNWLRGIIPQKIELL
jgi:hypothetical protein